MKPLEKPTARVLVMKREPIQREEELVLARRYVLLGIIVRILDHDIRVLHSSEAKLPKLYETMLLGLQDRVLLELAALRKQLRSKGIEMLEEIRSEDGLEAQYICRGYRHRFILLWGYIRSESEQLLRTYCR
ncbi:hypothetical protein [Paenibacillus sp. FSL H8-0537]|uniref:hypothetical protein n=1 Tax=Paenibacillus sp. FSL H8-0537 TaxID=2921399 RepID=UPI0031010A5F